MKFESFLAEKGISKVDFTAKSAEELAGLYNEYNEKKAEELSKAIELKASKEDIDSLKSEIKEGQLEQMKSLNDVLKAHGVAIKKLSEKESSAKTDELETVAKGLQANKEGILALKTSKSGAISFKVAGDMLGSTNVSGGNVPVEQRLAGLDTIASRTPRLLDIVSRGTAESNIISWVSQANKDGQAGGTAEGVTKNQIDFDLVVTSETLKKRTAYIKISEEMVEDIAFIQSEINNELIRELLKDVEAQVFGGDGTGTNLNGIKTVASAFSAGVFALTVDNANEADVLTVASDQIKVAEHDAPNYIMMHPSDLTKLKLIKTSTTDKRYIDRLAMVAGQMSLDGIQILETTLVPIGEYLIGNFALSTVYDKGSIRVEVGRDGNDFTKNMITVLAEWRGLNIVKTNQRSAFVAGVFATNKASLETI